VITDETRARIDRLRDQANQGFPTAWIAENEGDEVAGTFKRLEKGNTRFGTAWIVILDDGALEHAIWLVHTVLRNEFRKIRPVPGELVYVRYDGKKVPDGGGAAYEVYTVKVDRKAEGVRWDEVGAADEISSRVVNQPAADDPGAIERPAPSDDDVPF